MSQTEEEFDPYRVLGLPVGVDEETLQRRYRELVRKHHPDVSSDSEKAHRRFVRIQQAYRELMDPDQRARWEQKAGYNLGSAPTVTIGEVANQVDELLRRGRRLLQQRRLREARDAVAEAIELNPFSAEAYRLLGDIYMAGGNTQMCLDLYQEAKLLEAPLKGPRANVSQPTRTPAPSIPTRPSVRLPLLGVGFAVAAGCLVLMQLTDFAQNPWTFVALGSGAAFLLAASGVASGVIEPFDEVLGLADVTEPHRPSTPSGLYIIVLSLITPVAGVVFYLIVSLLSECFSKGTLKIYLITFGVTLLAWVGSGGARSVLLYGPSVAFLAGLVGWLAGSFVTPGEWWRR
ncbi:MAG: J domain-containing protein [Candidatus Zipacnadales bacterium]